MFTLPKKKVNHLVVHGSWFTFFRELIISTGEALAIYRKFLSLRKFRKCCTVYCASKSQPELDLAVEILARSVQDAMSALSDLQCAVMYSVAEGQGSDPPLKLLSKSCGIFSRDSKRYILATTPIITFNSANIPRLTHLLNPWCLRRNCMTLQRNYRTSFRISRSNTKRNTRCSGKIKAVSLLCSTNYIYLGRSQNEVSEFDSNRDHFCYEF